MTSPDVRIQHLLGLIEQLQALPYADQLRVFGSMASGSLNPGDLDVVLDCTGTRYTDFSQLKAYAHLIKIARAHYGLFDPFIRFDNGLLVRNDMATGWVSSKGARALWANMKQQGRTLAEVVQTYKTLNQGEHCA